MASRRRSTHALAAVPFSSHRLPSGARSSACSEATLAQAVEKRRIEAEALREVPAGTNGKLRRLYLGPALQDAAQARSSPPTTPLSSTAWAMVPL